MTKRYSFLLASLLMLFPILAFAQKTEETQPTANNAIIPQGTAAKLALQTRLHSKINEVGDEVIAILHEPVRTSEGRVAIPRGTEFIGRITQVQAAKRPQREATMTVIFEKMRMPYGTEKISAIITAIDDYGNDEKLKAKNEEGKVGGGRSGSRTARNAGIGGGIGSLGGILIGAAGGGIGGVAGGIGGGVLAGVLTTKGNDIKLETGTILRIRFERELSLPVTDN